MIVEFDGAPSYEYEPLDLTKHQIRLIKLDGEPVSQTICCKIATFDLTEAPPYTALSYTWGTPSPTYSIWLNERKFDVRENLYRFLIGFRPCNEDPVYIWIDQICINQRSAIERNHQVAQMRDIYQRSLHVISWLGRKESDVEAAQAFHDTGDVMKLKALLSNKYFTRIWIIQEILLAPEVRLLCGNILISSPDMKELAETCSWSELPNVPLALFAEGCVSFEMWIHPLKNLETVINRYSGNDCADPRDKVYGLLGLARSQDDQDQTLPTVDYEKPIHEVFLDAISAISSLHTDDFDTFNHVWRSKSFLYFAEDLGLNMGLSQVYLNRLKPFLEEWLMDAIKKPALEVFLKDFEIKSTIRFRYMFDIRSKNAEQEPSLEGHI